MQRQFNIISSGQYLPNRVVSSEELDILYKKTKGTTEKRCGVKKRHYVTDETNSQMAKYAILEALKKANLSINDIDCIVATSGTYEQPIPCNAALIQKELGLSDSGIPCFDVNSTCLSFLVGLDLITYPLSLGKYKNVVLVSSEIASIGLNYENFESSSLFGDGAVAFIFSSEDKNNFSKILSYRLETYSSGAHFTEIKGGGAKFHPREYNKLGEDYFTFNMDGRAVVKLSMKYSENFMSKLLNEANLTMDDIKYIVPHQASPTAIKLVGNKMGFHNEKVIKIVENVGNVISACIPMTWHHLLNNYSVNKGDKILLIGTSAGMSIGGMILEI